LISEIVAVSTRGIRRLTSPAFTDTRLSELIAKVGKENAQLAWQAGNAAIHTIESTIADEKIHCDFVRVMAVNAYPTHPSNGGPLPKNLPKSSIWTLVGNGWPARVHNPTVTIYDRRLGRQKCLDLSQSGKKEAASVQH
jgi:hypothetical protein